MTCPIRSLKVWKDLVEIHGENISFFLWDKYDGNVPDVFYEKQYLEDKSKNEEPVLNNELDFIMDNFKKELISSKPVIKLDFLSNKQLVESQNPIENREIQNEFKDTYKEYVKLINCLWR